MRIPVHDLIPFFVHGYDNKIKYSIKRLSIKYSYLKSDIVIVPFSSNKNKLIELFRVNPEKIRVIPYGVNHETYFRDDNIQKIPKSVAFLGEAKRAKGLDTLIRAFQIVIRSVPDATLVIASSGNELEKMKRLAEEFLPAGSFKFLGFIEENKMREFYNSAQLFVFPSRYGFGLSALEAMACGTPAIV
ncbi:MAG: glycosyltransferase, partial [Lentisphaerota bacterium]